MNFLSHLLTRAFYCSTLLLAGCGAVETDNAVSYECDANGYGGYSRTICDFKSKAEFDDFVTGLLNTGTPYKMRHVNNLPCEGNVSVVSESPVSLDRSSEETVPVTTTTHTAAVQSSSAIPYSDSNQNDSILNVHRAPNALLDDNTLSANVMSSDAIIEHKVFTGNVGKLSASFNLVFKQTGTVNGSYSYDRNPEKIYMLQGASSELGGLRLIEYTRGKETAKCSLTLINGCYSGTMNNTDGRSFPMKMCE